MRSLTATFLLWATIFNQIALARTEEIETQEVCLEGSSDIELPVWTQELDLYSRVAVKAALLAGRILEEKQDSGFVVTEKEGAANVVTDSDVEAEKAIIQILQSQFPAHGILAEENLSQEVPKNDYVWIIDPLDGSKNYSKGVPIYSISIALLNKGEPICGVILIPRLQQLFVANEKSAYLNGKLLAVTKMDELSKALLASGYPYAVKENPLHCIEVENAMIKSGSQVNNFGTSVLHLAYVAAGIFDGKFHAGLRTWDVAAASLMIKNAGGQVTDWTGKPLNLLTLQTIDILASNGLLHDAMLNTIKEATD